MMIARLACSSVLALTLAGSVFAGAHAVADGAAVERRWLERLEPADRQPLELLIGYAPPAFDDDLNWKNVDTSPTWQGLRDRVVVIQSWTSSSEIGRRSLNTAQQIINEFSETDVQLIALHTPDGADNAETYIERREITVPAAVDSDGEFCDALGVYRRPVNIVIDRNGAVRFAGLNAAGLKAAITQLIDEPRDPHACPEPRGAAGTGQFPPITGSVRSARDLRGQAAPPFYVQQWITDAPNMHGKVVMVDYWATWCGPCISSIPRLNQYAERFADDLVIVGVSNETASAFETGMQRRNLSLNGFRYSLALDTSRRMQDAVQVRGIPHVKIMCSDWIVRWQGHPGSLNEQILEQIVAANGGGASSPKGRWAASR